jgi:hypothetical protein
VSVRINSDGEPQAKKEFLVPASNNSFAEIDLNKIKFRYDDNGFLMNLKGFSGKVDNRFFTSMARSLRGREGNLIVASRKGFNSIDFDIIKRDVAYQDLYINSFLHEIIFSIKKDYDKIYKYLFEALLHGLEHTIIIQKLQTLFDSLGVSAEKRKEVINLTIKIAEDVSKLSKEGKTAQLIEILTNPDSVLKIESSNMAVDIKVLITSLECLVKDRELKSNRPL